jgi:hypothetical protein
VAHFGLCIAPLRLMLHHPRRGGIEGDFLNWDYGTRGSYHHQPCRGMSDLNLFEYIAIPYLALALYFRILLKMHICDI